MGVQMTHMLAALVPRASDGSIRRHRGLRGPLPVAPRRAERPQERHTCDTTCALTSAGGGLCWGNGGNGQLGNAMALVSQAPVSVVEP